MTDGNNPQRPRLFVGSSAEGKTIAEHLQLGLDAEVDVVVWSQGVFGLSETTLESLLDATRDVDFAALVLTADDVARTRGRQRPVPRDNVVFELGLFIGALGRNRAFVVCPGDDPVELPSDLQGVTTARYHLREHGNLEASLGPACTQIKTAIRRAIADPESRRTREHRRQRVRRAIARRRRRRSLGIAHVSDRDKFHRIVDISTSGALLETDGEIPVGQKLELDLRLESGSAARVIAEVVRVQLPDWRRVGGVGVKFVDCAPGAMNAIHDYVEAETDTTAWAVTARV